MPALADHVRTHVAACCAAAGVAAPAFSDAQVRAALREAFDPAEPRVPAGEPGGGEWTEGGGPAGKRGGGADNGGMGETLPPSLRALKPEGATDDEALRAARHLVAADWPEAAGMPAEALAREFDLGAWGDQIRDQADVYRRVREGDRRVPPAHIVNDSGSKRPSGVYRDREGGLWVLWSAMEEGHAYTNPVYYAFARAHADPPFYFRWTDNKGEDRIAHKLRSKDHATGRREKGMSVAADPSYQSKFGKYRYGYLVAGEVVGRGADGEPVLRNVKPLTKPAEEIPAEHMRRYEDFVTGALADQGLTRGDFEALRHLRKAERAPEGLVFLYGIRPGSYPRAQRAGA